MKGKWEARKHSYRIYYVFQSEIGGGKRRIKIEINTREHFAIDGYQNRPLSMQSEWYSGQCEIVTFSLEELLATKLSALYQRRKGRDLFDLWMAIKLNPNWNKAVHIFLKYTEHQKKQIHRNLLNKNLQEKIEDPRFQQDTHALIMNQKAYDIQKAAAFVTNEIFSMIP